MNAAPVESHRLFSRVPFSAAVTLHLPGQTLEVGLLDIALKGAMVQTTQPVSLRLEDHCQLRLPLNHDGEVITMVGRIAHLEGRRIGIRCEQMDLTSLTLLRRLLELNTGDADLMHRELSQLFATHPTV
ncbi:PilZ domain-containing protein [Rhodoferax sp.]|uniref:PilZ domain-containing protein n=1 Tax=Rhodoferax sp. TaxID=50421 RepID=UPI002636964D|nr:PilZ domain-containing protein [Rhodoferax sp.]MDD2926024.1 PilZ domain-containing protein [Rhodoferax sp.]